MCIAASSGHLSRICFGATSEKLVIQLHKAYSQALAWSGWTRQVLFANKSRSRFTWLFYIIWLVACSGVFNTEIQMTKVIWSGWLEYAVVCFLVLAISTDYHCIVENCPDSNLKRRFKGEVDWSPFAKWNKSCRNCICSDRPDPTYVQHCICLVHLHCILICSDPTYVQLDTIAQSPGIPCTPTFTFTERPFLDVFDCSVFAVYLHCICSVFALYLQCICSVFALYIYIVFSFAQIQPMSS